MTNTQTVPTTAPTFRLNKKGEVVIFGLLAELEGRHQVTVRIEGRPLATRIASLGKPFAVAGDTMVYAYLAAGSGPSVREVRSATPSRPASTPRPVRRSTSPRQTGRGWTCDEGHRNHVASCICCNGQIGM